MPTQQHKLSLHGSTAPHRPPVQKKKGGERAREGGSQPVKKKQPTCYSSAVTLPQDLNMAINSQYVLDPQNYTNSLPQHRNQSNIAQQNTCLWHSIELQICHGPAETSTGGGRDGGGCNCKQPAVTQHPPSHHIHGSFTDTDFT